MKSIVGLLSCDEAVGPAVKRLEEAGVEGDEIQIISTPESVNELFSCDPVCTMLNYAAWGAGIGVSVYLVAGAAAALCQCNLMQYGITYGLGTILGLILFGAFVGGFLGLMVGATEAEKDTHLYSHGIRIGGRVIKVRTREGDCAKVKDILEAEHTVGIKMLPAAE